MLDWKKLIAGKAPTILDLEQSLAKLRDQAAEARTEVDTLAAGRRAVLRDGSDDDLRQYDERAGAAARRRDRTDVAIEEVAAKLDDARTKRADSERRARYDAACKQRDAARADLQRIYPGVVRTMRDLLRTLAEAETVLAVANADLPPGAEPIASPEDFRQDRGPAKRVFSTKRVMLWVDARDKPWRDDVQDKFVTSRTGEGYVPGGGPKAARKLAFDRVTYLPAAGFKPLQPLAVALNLPPAAPGEVDGWRPVATEWPHIRFADTVLRQLDTLHASHPPQNIEPQVEHILVDEADRSTMAVSGL